MATYILFWNPAISSYTRERFMEDFRTGGCVGNWSINEYQDVEYGDTFYMVACGDYGPRGIMMRGEITSSCYEDEDWSPKGRPNIHYADIIDAVTIDPWSEAPLLTPELLTKLLPDFNWYGGHSGRRLTDDYATRLDMIWLEYIHSNPRMFAEGNATISEWCGVLLSEAMEEALRAQLPCECEVCGYSYRKAFGRDMDWHNYISPIPSRRLPTLFHTICRSCDEVEDEEIEEVLVRKNEVQLKSR